MTVKIKRNLLILFTLSLFAIAGCQKSDVSDAGHSGNGVKVFDDIGDAENSFMRIAASPGRLCMTYGIGGGWIYANGFFYVTTPFSKLMVTDNEGNLIRRDSLRGGLSIGDILALDDGSFLIAAFNANTSPIYLFHINRDGQKIKEDSVLLPVSFAVSGYTSVFLCRSVNGNPLLYGTDVMGFGFIVEHVLNGSSLWAKQTNFQFSSCLPTPFGGYLFAGIKNDYSPYAYLMNTTATGDSIWTKSFFTGQSPWVRKIIPTANGHYRFCFNATDYASPVPLYIYEVNAEGDSLNAVKINYMKDNYVGTMVPLDDGGVFVLTNNTPQNLIGAQPNFSQINTTYVNLDEDLRVTEKGIFQNKTTDLLSSACKTSDGKIACFGLIQSYGQAYYKPELIFIK